MINFLAMKCMKDYLSAACLEAKLRRSLMIIFFGFSQRVALKNCPFYFYPKRNNGPIGWANVVAKKKLRENEWENFSLGNPI